MHNPYDESIRNDTAKHYKEIRRILRGNMAEIENNAPKTRHYWIGWSLVVILSVLMAIFLFCGCAMGQNFPVSENYTNIQYVNAIYMAEGGKNGYLYGIRSVHYKNAYDARRICLNTVRNNRRRFKEYGYRHYPRFIDFLQSRYCPTKGRNFTKGEARLNKYWIKNVEYYLHKKTKGA